MMTATTTSHPFLAFTSTASSAPLAPQAKRKRSFANFAGDQQQQQQQHQLPQSQQPQHHAQTQRTLKRWRNNRPSEEHVHQYTLAKLFSAAKHLPAPVPVKTRPEPQHQLLQQQQQQQQQQPQQLQREHRQQRSAFSLLRSAPTPAQRPMISEHVCQDCERPFTTEEGVEGEEACLGCGRTVCGWGCSASNGEGRVCLECMRS